jgi:LCP family protein required for cell wall assembly
MADRPGTDGPEEGPDYKWLYGGAGAPPSDPDATRPVTRRPRPDETRLMPTQPRSGPAPSNSAPSNPAQSQPVRPTPPPLAPPPDEPPGAPSSTGRGRRRPRFRVRWVLLVLVAWLIYIVAVPILAWTRVEKVEFEPEGERPADQPGTTYLMVGSDSRADLSEDERKDLSTGNASGGRTDTIMLLHTGSGPNVLVSIPRDSIVDIPGHGSGKINAAYAFGGAPLLVQTIENETGIRVDEYVEIGMDGVAGIVDAVGGVEVCPKENMRDPLAGLNIKKGCQEVDGKTALAYARSRKTASLGDIDRARRQREVVSAVGEKVLSPWTVVNPVRWWRLNMAIPDFFRFGEGTGPMQTGLWAMAMTRVDGDAGLTCGVPIRDLAVNWDEERAEQLFALIIEDETDKIGKDLCTPTGQPR